MVKRTEKEWEELAKEFYASNCEQKEWCQRKGINVYTFRDRLSRLRKVGKAPAVRDTKEKEAVKESVKFIELQPNGDNWNKMHSPEKSINKEQSIKIQVREAQIEIPAVVAPNTLQTLLKVVLELC